jgi:hypothetical protein
MHDSSPTNQLAAHMERNQACTQCHEKIAKNVQAHTHHASDSSGSLCYNCHMPYTTYGLLKALRSHEISSPSLKQTMAAGRPNACNLCHLDKTLDWTNQKLASWYHQPRENLSDTEKSVAASVLWSLQGDAAERALLAWHFGWEPARRASGEEWIAPYLALSMQDEYPAVRYIAARSLKRLPGFADFQYDYVATDHLNEAARDIFSRWSKGKGPKRRTDPALLLNAQGELREDRARELLQNQNRRVVELDE